MATFKNKLENASKKNKSLLCVGLDPDPELMPVENVEEFGKAIVLATSDLVCAYKPNMGFYEALGQSGLTALKETMKIVPSHIPIIGDGKRGDVHKFYPKVMFEEWGFDATTVNPYGGGDTIEPFVDYQEKGIFVWCRSSNPGAREFQDLIATSPYGGDSRPLYEWVATQALTWNKNENIGLVVGATYPDELLNLRNLCPTMPILIPGIGAQQGALEKSVQYGIDDSGLNVIISASRSIIYAGNKSADYQSAIRNEALKLRDRINEILDELDKPWTAIT